MVEVSFVLTALGLIVGVVLQGKEMMTNAKLKRLEADSSGLVTAMFSYQDRYRHLPGDDPDAAQRFDIYNKTGTTDVAVNGNGDGVIGDGSDWNANHGTQINADSEEPEKFFGHLRAAGLIMGGGGYDSTRYTNAFGGLIGIQDGSLGIAGHVLIFGQIEGPVIQIIDGRQDDGKPNSGRLQANLVAQSMDYGSDNTSLVKYSDTQKYNYALRM